MSPRFPIRRQYDEELDYLYSEACVNYDPGESKTQQHHATDADINVIARRYGLTDESIPAGFNTGGTYGDFGEGLTFREAHDRILQAGEMFRTLPAAVRSRFHNDPRELHEYLQEGGNYDEAVRLGLVNPIPEEKPPNSDTKTPEPKG